MDNESTRKAMSLVYGVCMCVHVSCAGVEVTHPDLQANIVSSVL